MHHTVGSPGTPALRDLLCLPLSSHSSSSPRHVIVTIFSSQQHHHQTNTLHSTAIDFIFIPSSLLYQLLIISTTPVHAFYTCIYFAVPTFLLLSPVSFLSLDLGMYLPIYTPDYSDGESTSQCTTLIWSTSSVICTDSECPVHPVTAYPFPPLFPQN